MSGIQFSVNLMGYGDYNAIERSGVSGGVQSTSDTNSVDDAALAVQKGECQTCKERKYQDGSDENVSFKSAAHIDPESAATRVRGHEQEHVSNAYTEAAQKGGKVINASVSLHTAICPEIVISQTIKKRECKHFRI